MTRFPQLLIEKLRGYADASTARDTAIASGDCLSKALVVGFTSSLYPEIDEHGVTDEEAAGLKCALVALYHRNPNSAEVSSVIWALAQARDPKLHGLFIEHARAAMRRLSVAFAELSQCVVGLDEFSIPTQVESGRSELMSEVINQADAHLRMAGIVVPLA
jgi:hypothetical protein